MPRIITQRDIENAARLKEIWITRKIERGYTQEQIAKMLGMRQNAVSQYLNAKIALNADAIIRFARVLDCELGDIDPEYEDFSATVNVPIIGSMGGPEGYVEYEKKSQRYVRVLKRKFR